MYKSATVALFTVIFALAAFSAYAADTEGTQKDIAHKTASQVHQGRGIVNKLNLDAGKVNISHEAIDSLKWPKMTMDFNVQDKSGLAEVKPGMKVDFDLTMQGKGYKITHIAPAKE